VPDLAGAQDLGVPSGFGGASSETQEKLKKPWILGNQRKYDFGVIFRSWPIIWLGGAKNRAGEQKIAINRKSRGFKSISSR